MIRLTALLAVAATALALVASLGAAPAAPVKLSGSVGPGETIVLKKGSARVKTLKAAATRSPSATAPRSTTSVSVGRWQNLGHRPDRHQVDHAEPEAGPLHVRLRPALGRHDRQLPSRQVATGSDSTIHRRPSPHSTERAPSPASGEARAEELQPLAVELGDRPFDVAGAEEVPPGTHLVVDLPRAVEDQSTVA